MALNTHLSTSAYDIKEIVYTNLMLLGFSPHEAEAKFKIPFSKDMFDLPNRKGMEVIFHFLFHRMDASLAKQELRDCWPILDKKQEQGFRKACSNWLTGLAKEPLANMPRINASTLMAPGGERFYFLLLQLTTYAIRNAIQSDFRSSSAQFVPLPPVSTNKPSASYEKVLQARAILHRQQFLENTKRLDSLRQHWSSYAIGLTDRHRELSKRLRVLEEKIDKAEESQHAQLTANLSQVSGISKETLKTACQVHGPQQVHARADVRNHNINQLRKLRSQLETFLNYHSHSSDVLDAVMQRSKTGQGSVSLTSEAATFDLSESSLRDMPSALQSQLRHQQTTSAGDVIIGSLSQTCQNGIAHLLDATKKGGLPDLTSAVSHLTTLVDLHREQLSSVKVLKSQLANEYIPSLEVAVQAARDQVKRGIGTPCKALPTFVPQLDLMSASPGLQFSLDGAGGRGHGGQHFDSPALSGFRVNPTTGSIPRPRVNTGSVTSTDLGPSLSHQPFMQPSRHDVHAATSSSLHAESWRGTLKSPPDPVAHALFSPRKAVSVSLASALSDLQHPAGGPTGVPMATPVTTVAAAKISQTMSSASAARSSSGQAPAVEDSMLHRWQERLSQLRHGQGQRAAAVSPCHGDASSGDLGVGSRSGAAALATPASSAASATLASASLSSAASLPRSAGAWTSMLDSTDFLLGADVFPAPDSSVLFDQPAEEGDLAAYGIPGHLSSPTTRQPTRIDSCEEGGVGARSPLLLRPVVTSIQFVSPTPACRSTPLVTLSTSSVSTASMSTASMSTASMSTASMSTASMSTASVSTASMSTPSGSSLPETGEQLQTKLRQWQERLERLQLSDSPVNKPSVVAFSSAPLSTGSPAPPEASSRGYAADATAVLTSSASTSTGVAGAAAGDGAETGLYRSTRPHSVAGRSNEHTPLDFKTDDMSMLPSPLLVPQSLDDAGDDDLQPEHVLGGGDLPATPTNDRHLDSGGSQVHHDLLRFSAVRAAAPLQTGMTPSFKSMQHALSEYSPLWPAVADDDDEEEDDDDQV